MAEKRRAAAAAPSRTSFDCGIKKVASTLRTVTNFVWPFGITKVASTLSSTSVVDEEDAQLSDRTRTGFSAWKNALARFAKHETSHTQEAVMKLHSVATANIAGVLNSKTKEQQLQRQRMLLKHPSFVRYHARQGFAIRGHEKREGNMIQLLRMWSAHDADMKECWDPSFNPSNA